MHRFVELPRNQFCRARGREAAKEVEPGCARELSTQIRKRNEAFATLDPFINIVGNQHSVDVILKERG